MNKRRLSIIFKLFMLAGLLAAVVVLRQGRVLASANLNQAVAEANPHIYAAGECQSCHAANDPRLANVTAWAGGLSHAAQSACPAVYRIQEELYYTERLFLIVERAQTGLPANPNRAAALAASFEGYNRLLDAPVTNLDAFTSEAQGVRYKLGKLYAEVNQAVDQQKRLRAMLIAVGVSLVIAASLAWGYWNTRRIAPQAQRAFVLDWRGGLATAALLLTVVAFFSLPLLRQPTEPETLSTPAAQAMQTALDAGARLAQSSDRAQGRAWLLAQTAARLQRLDADAADQILKEAVASAALPEENRTALWGQAALAQEAAVSETALLEKAALAAEKLNYSQGRVWGLRLTAETWSRVNKEAAMALLNQAIEQAAPLHGVYRDLDIKGIAVAYAWHDTNQALSAARQIEDPVIRSQALAHIAALDAAAQPAAEEAALAITQPLPRLHSLLLLVRPGRPAAPALVEALRQTVAALPADQQAWAMADVAAATQDAGWLANIPADDPAAPAYAALQLKQYPQAWQAALSISDPYEQGRAQAEIVNAWAAGDSAAALFAARQIAQPVLRQRALLSLLAATHDPALMTEIDLPYLRVQALTRLGLTDQAVKEAASLKDKLPLVELALKLAETDPQAALALVDQMNREADRSVVLTALAGRDPRLFERALGMAAAARIRSEALNPTRQSLALADLLWNAYPQLARQALAQAQQLAQAIK